MYITSQPRLLTWFGLAIPQCTLLARLHASISLYRDFTYYVTLLARLHASISLYRDFTYYVTLCDFIIDIRYIIISRLLPLYCYYYYYYYCCYYYYYYYYYYFIKGILSIS